MANDFSFDIVSEVNMQEADNAVNQSTKEISQRFDFRGSKSKIILHKDKNEIELIGDDDYKLKSVADILNGKLVKRGISLKSISYSNTQNGPEGTMRQTATIQQGIPSEKVKEIVKLVKDTKLKVQAQIQNEQVRISGRKKDDLQTVMQLLNTKDLGIALQFTNYRG